MDGLRWLAAHLTAACAVAWAAAGLQSKPERWQAGSGAVLWRKRLRGKDQGPDEDSHGMASLMKMLVVLVQPSQALTWRGEVKGGGAAVACEG